jgi:hypothetical protein
MSNGEAPSTTINDNNNDTDNKSISNTTSTSNTDSDSRLLSANVSSSVANGPDALPNNTDAKQKMTVKAAEVPTKTTSQDDGVDASVALEYGWRTGVVIIVVWLLLFVGAVLLRRYAAGRAWKVLGVFFYVGTIVFGGGPVVIPLLYQYIVTPGWAEPSAFLLGLAIINSMPGACTYIYFK